MQELIEEIKFISKCTGNTKTVKRKKSHSQGASMDDVSRSVSRSTISQHRDLPTADDYGFRPSLRNLEKLDLMPDNEVMEDV